VDERQVAAMQKADHRQADYFRNELRRQIGLLEEQSQKIRTTLEDAERRGDRLYIHRSQNALRATAIGHANVRQMLAALDRRLARGGDEPATTTG
jgi:hypothetical protein